jgi:hypothetical protein
MVMINGAGFQVMFPSGSVPKAKSVKAEFRVHQLDGTVRRVLASGMPRLGSAYAVLQEQWHRHTEISQRGASSNCRDFGNTDPLRRRGVKPVVLCLVETDGFVIPLSNRKLSSSPKSTIRDINAVEVTWDVLNVSKSPTVPDRPSGGGTFRPCSVARS